MLRISRIEGSSKAQKLRLDGQVAGPWVTEVRGACVELLRTRTRGKTRLVLDLAAVSFLDANGIALFRELAEQGVQFVNGSAFIAEQLKGVADVSD